MKIAFFTQMLY